MSQRTEKSHQTVPSLSIGTKPTSDNVHARHHMRWTSGTTLPLNTKTTGEGGGLQRVDSRRFPRKPVLPFIVSTGIYTMLFKNS